MAISLVPYYRVSDQKQRRSGLGLEAQQAVVQAYEQRTGGRIIASYTEVESGRRSDRPELARAIAHARLAPARLVVAKLDRLSRDVRFLLGLIDSGVATSFLDLPGIDTGDPITGRLVLTVMAAIAEFESRRIGQRIREAYAAKVARGERNRNPRGCSFTPEEIRMGCAAATVARRKRATEFRGQMRLVIGDLRAKGFCWEECARRLNEQGFKTARGLPWTLANVERVCALQSWE